MIRCFTGVSYTRSPVRIALFATLLIACLQASVRAQDSALVAQLALVDRLVEHKIISETAHTSILNWVKFLQSDQTEMTTSYAQQQLSRPVIEKLAFGAQAYRTLQWYRYVADSLQRAGNQSGAKKQMSSQQLGSAIDAIYAVSGQHEEPPPRTNLGPEVMQWAMGEPAFARSVKDLESQIGYAHESLYTSTDPPVILIDKLRELNLFDDALAHELHITQACDQLHDGAGVLMRAGKLLHDRDWQSRSRFKVEQRIKDLTAAGFMDEALRAALWKDLGPYAWPSDFEIATASSPHVVFACNERDWTTESYYHEHLPKLSGVIPELSPTDVQIERRAADSLLVRAGYEVQVSFTNNGKRYAFSVYEGGTVRNGERTQPCYMMYLALRTLNKALCDAHSNFRIVKHEFGEGDCGYYETTSMCLSFIDMTRCRIWWPEQARTSDALGMLTTTQHDPRCEQLFSMKYCADSIAAVIGRIRSIGVLDHLSEAQIDSATIAANMTMPRAWDDVLSCFPDVVAHPYGADPRRDKTAYQEELGRLVGISHGTIRIERLREHWSRNRWRGKVRIAFNLNGQRIDLEPIATEPGIVMDETIIRINHAMTQQGALGRFCAVRSDRDVSIVFLTKAQYEALSGNVVSSYFGDPWAAELPEYLRR